MTSDRLRGVSVDRVVGLIGVAMLVLAPALFSDFWLTQIVGRGLWLGLVAMSVCFLAGYVGMISLGQVALFAIGGFTYANMVLAEGGSPVAVDPWAGVVIGLLAATVIGLFLGAVASRSVGIYFLMITFAYAVLGFFFFAEVNQLSGFGGVNNVTKPDLVGGPFSEPHDIYYTTIIVVAALYALVRYVGRSPFGLTLQGIRDEPDRMQALGYNVPLHRTLAFGLAAFIAAAAGILSVWYNTRISPGSVDVTRTIDVLVIAVIGGLLRLEGAFIGGILFAVLDNETRGVSFIGSRFNTVIGAIFLVIVLLSPGGLLGIWESAKAAVGRVIESRRGGTSGPPHGAVGEPGAS